MKVLLYTDKKKRKFSSYIRKFKMEQLQSHIWLTDSSILIYGEIFAHFLIYSIRKPFLIYDFATAPLWIFLYTRPKFIFFFISVYLFFSSFQPDYLTDWRQGPRPISFWSVYCMLSQHLQNKFISTLKYIVLYSTVKK